jgi:hypothetical protein
LAPGKKRLVGDIEVFVPDISVVFSRYAAFAASEKGGRPYKLPL